MCILGSWSSINVISILSYWLLNLDTSLINLLYWVFIRGVYGRVFTLFFRGIKVYIYDLYIYIYVERGFVLCAFFGCYGRV